MAHKTTGRFETRELLVDWVMTIHTTGLRSSQATIARICNVSKATVQNLVRSDEAEAWLKQQNNPD